MYDRSLAFLRRAGTIILATTILVWALSYYPTQPHLTEEFRARSATATPEEQARLATEEAGIRLRESYLGQAGHAIEPLVRPLGWDWKIGMATLASFPAREVIIAALGTIYNLGNEQSEESVELAQCDAGGALAGWSTRIYTDSRSVGYGILCALLSVWRDVGDD
jgi:ferrous iron transport protein B